MSEELKQRARQTVAEIQRLRREQLAAREQEIAALRARVEALEAGMKDLMRWVDPAHRYIRARARALLEQKP